MSGCVTSTAKRRRKQAKLEKRSQRNAKRGAAVRGVKR